MASKRKVKDKGVKDFIIVHKATYFKRLEALDYIACYDIARCPWDPHLDYLVHLARKALDRK